MWILVYLHSPNVVVEQVLIYCVVVHHGEFDVLGLWLDSAGTCFALLLCPSTPTHSYTLSCLNYDTVASELNFSLYVS